MDQSFPTATIEPIPPPDELLNARPGEWITLDETHPTLSYLNKKFTKRTALWEGARFSKAAYLYRDTVKPETLAVKYYQPKTGNDAEQHAERECQKIEQVHAIGLASGSLRAIKPLSAWRGVLFLEYVSGLTLADIIAVRRSQPGLLQSALVKVAEFLAKLHTAETDEEVPPNPAQAIQKAQKYVAQLEKYGVLEDETEIAESIKLQIGQWEQKPIWTEYKATLCHGDATTTNFIFPSQEEMVSIDWERLTVADPATDVGRLLAEVNYSLRHQGALGSEVKSLADITLAAYSGARPFEGVSDGFMERTRFHQASSTLRIARNGWISRSDRRLLVTQALALLV